MSAVLDLVVRVVVLLSLAWLGTVVLRRRSASINASVWTAALVAVLLLPLVSAFAPMWQVPVWPAREPETMTSQAALIPISEPSAPAVVVQPANQDAPVAAQVAVAASSDTSWNWSQLSLLVLAVIALALLLRLGVGYVRLRRIASDADPADPDWCVLVGNVAGEIGIARKVDVRITDATNVPAVAGWWKPVLLVPIESQDWSRDLRRAVVLHEMAHVARLDGLSQLLGQIACAVYWFVPLSWYGARRAAALRERASDDFVLQAGVLPSTYAQSLVALARTMSGGLPSPATVAMAEPSRIVERVAAILNARANRERVTWSSAAALFLLMCGTTAGIGAIELTERTGPAPIDGARLFAGEGELTTKSPAPRAEAVSAPRQTRSARNEQTPASQPASRFCAGRGLDHSSSSIQEDNNRRRWTVKLSGSGCTVDLRAEGDIQFNEDFTDIARIGSGGFFRVDVTEGGVRRQLDIESRNGTLARTWRVDGQERAYDADARTWFAAFLIELDRRTGIGVDVRLPHLIRQGGVDAVLKETALVVSDYARNIYYTKLPKATKLSAADATRVLRQAAGVMSSDHYGSELVRAYGSWAQDPSARAALFEMVERMKSDHYQATSIESIVGAGAPGQPDMEALVRLVPRMSSDHYKAQVLTKVLKADSVSANHRAALAGAVSTIASDHYAAEVLKLLIQKGIGEDAVRRPFFEAAARIQSDHYHAEVLQAVANAPSVTERDLLDTVASAKGVGSDHYRAQVLERVARNRSATDRVRTAVLDAISGLSSHYAERVRRAAGK